MNYFTNCKSIEEAKKAYRELLKLYHPDHAGEEGEAITKNIIAQFNAFLKTFMSRSYSSFCEENEWEEREETVTRFQDILEKIINLDCQIEIIGFWIYCFNSKDVKEQLKELGFWFSSKHLAWVFSGTHKKRRAGFETLDEIRDRKGSQKVNKKSKTKNKEENEQETKKYPARITA
jgi:hypothetical protein